MAKEYFEYPVIIDILMTMACCIGVVGNLLVCLTILRVRHLRNLTNYLILNLAVSDLLTCFIFFLEISLKFLKLPAPGAVTAFTYIYCHLLYNGYLFFSFSYVSVYNLVIISFERYTAIVYPLRYAQVCTTRRVCVAVAAAWVAGFSQYLIHLVGIHVDEGNMRTRHCTYNHPWELHFIPFTTGFLLPLCAMMWAYYQIIKRLKQSARQQVAPSQAHELIRARRRVIHLMLLITAVFIALFGTTQPTQIIMVVTSSDEYEKVDTAGNVLCFILYLLNETPAMLNSVANPIIYAWKYKAFRRGMREGLCPCLKRPWVRPTGSEVSNIAKKSNSDSSC